MAIADTNKVDFLWKKLIYGVTDTTSNKDATNETISSPLPVYAANIWAQGDSTNIPVTPPAATTSVVQLYTGGARVQMTSDPTSPANRAWLSNLTDWIPPTFGAGYLVQVYMGDPNVGPAVRLNSSTSGEEFVFDYNAGVLNFVNAVPASKTATIGSGTVTIANGIYIVAYRYVGMKGTQAGNTKSSVVANIAARNAMTGMNAGDIVLVQDASGIPTDASAGQWATYVYSGSAWTVIATQDSARSDALTPVALTVTPSSTNTEIALVGNGARVVEVSVDVTQAFDGTFAISVADVSNTIVLMSTDENDLQTVGSYVTTPISQFPESQDTQVNFFVSGTATVGNATVIITFA